MSDGEEPPRKLRIVRGNPSAEELAALVAVVASRPSGQPGARTNRSAWARRHRLARPPLRPSPSAWRDSALPR